MPRTLFLLGGSGAYDAVSEPFVTLAGGPDASIVLLLQGCGSEKYVPEITAPWAQRGVSRFCPIMPDRDGRLNPDATLTQLRQATGIFVGGGHTPTYHRTYTAGPIRDVIRERYDQGIPVAGCSAGALIAPQIAVLTPDETSDDGIRTPVGLGLANGFVVGVHFTELKALPYVLEAMAQTQTKVGWGIDEPACAVFEDGQFMGTLGRSVYEIRMTDFEAKAYTLSEHTEPYRRSCGKSQESPPACALAAGREWA